ncbi:DUF3265 domain-containing protein [Vibrio anguillarum]|nr:DUF3265 domain-containing protein [Vibrio anguillarum]AUB86606.1 DUF3265 domain-containing protein [Vibrio anguillarum]
MFLGIEPTTYITNASRGTANAWHFYYALVFSVYGVFFKFGGALSTP